MKARHKVLSCFLALTVLFTYLPPLYAGGQSYYGKKSARLEQLQKDYGTLDLNELYDTYTQVQISPEESQYYQKSYQELITIYDQLNDDISFLWRQNPAYLRARIEKTVKDSIIATAVIGVAVVATYYIGTYLAVSGFPIAGELVSYVPLNSASTATTLKSVEIGADIIRLNKLFRKGKRVKDIVKLSKTVARTTHTAKEMLLYTSLFIIDGIFCQEAFFALNDLSETVRKIQEDKYKGYLPANFSVSMRRFFKTAKYLNPLFEGDVQTAQENREKYLGKFLNTFDDMDDETRIPSMAEYLRIGKVITTIHVLELIRAELSNTNNPLRYDMASFDTFNYFYDSESQWLYSREELIDFLTPIHNALEQKVKDDRKRITKKFEEGDFNYSRSIL